MEESIVLSYSTKERRKSVAHTRKKTSKTQRTLEMLPSFGQFLDSFISWKIVFFFLTLLCLDSSRVLTQQHTQLSVTFIQTQQLFFLPQWFPHFG